MEHSFAWLAGFVVGLLLVAAVCFLFARKVHTDGARKPKFDERQELVRGRGYKYAFFTLMVYQLLYAVLKTAFGWTVLDEMTELFIGLYLAIGVYACYAIWHDAYFALNEKRVYYIWLFAVIAVINGGVGIAHILRGEVVVDGVINYVNSMNLLGAVLFLVVLAALLVKEIASRREEEG